MSKTVSDLADAVIERLDAKYDLVYVDYRDEFSPEQIAALVKGDVEAFDESFGEWEFESRWESIKTIITEAVEEAVRDDPDFDDVKDDLEPSTDEWERIREVIEGRDAGGYVKQLARQSGRVLLRIQVLNEDNGYAFQEVNAEQVLSDVGLQPTRGNVKAVDYALANASPEYSVLLGYWIVAVDVEDMLDLLTYEGDVEITGPHLYLGNPFTGGGFVTEEALEGTVRVKRADLRTDEDAFGWSIDKIYGGVSTSSFEVDIKPVTQTQEVSQ